MAPRAPFSVMISEISPRKVFVVVFALRIWHLVPRREGCLWNCIHSWFHSQTDRIVLP